MAAGHLLSSSDGGKPSAGGGAAADAPRRAAGWLSAFKPGSSSPPHHKMSTDGGSKADQWSGDGSASPDASGGGGTLWSPDVAAAMGYGKKGRAGSAFQWWILVLSALLAIGSFIAWIVFALRARDATQAALDAARIRLDWWGVLRAILLATAVCFPVFAAGAIGVSIWRATLASRLNIHAPDQAWMRRCKAFQVANVVSSVLLYGLLSLLVVSMAAHAVWAYSARTAHVGSYLALKYVDPIWNGTTSVVQASQSLVNNFVGLAQASPAVGRRLREAGGPVHPARLLASLTDADLASLPRPAREAGLAAAASLPSAAAAGAALQQALRPHARSLAQAGGLPAALPAFGELLSTAASGLQRGADAVGGLPRAGALDTRGLANLPFLPSLLPNGSSNPLFNTLRTVTDAVQGQLLNSTGCPIYCVDLRNQAWLEDGCVCSLQRVWAAYPHIAQVYGSALPATGCVFAMCTAAMWLLLHAASQWARTRSEAKLLARIPHAAKHALGVQQQAAAAASGGGSAAGGGKPVAAV